jgi:uncharacterized membrane protein YfcA
MFQEFLPPHLVPFPGLPLWVVAAVAAAHFLGFFIRGAFGFGSNMPIVLLTTWLLEPHHSIILVMLTATAAQVHLLPQGLRTADWRVTGSVTPGLLVGIALGTWIFAGLEADWLIVVMAVLIVAIVVLDRLHLIERISAVLPLRSPAVVTSLAATGATAGTISGGGTVYFLVVYMRLVCASPLALRGTSIVVSGAFILLRVAGIALAGLITPSVVVEAALLIPVVFLGTWSGTRAFHTSSSEGFYRALQVLLLVAAIALMGRGLARLF